MNLSSKNSLKSLINNTNNINNVELLLLFDDYEEEQDYYIKLLVSSKIKINFKYFNMQLTSHAKRNNFLAKYAIGDIILPINESVARNKKTRKRINLLLEQCKDMVQELNDQFSTYHQEDSYSTAAEQKNFTENF